jgi:hypothetical protein
MTTEAGKRLLLHHEGCPPCDCRMAERIDAIEAEARQQERERIEGWLRGVTPLHFHPGAAMCVPAFCAAGMAAAVLAVLEEPK